MTNSPNFASILDEAPTEVKVPPPVPVGSYICVVQGQPKYDKSTRKGTPYVEFQLKPVATLDDVDEEALADMGGFEDKMFRVTYYLTEDAVYRLDEFHTHCGIDITEAASRRTRNEDCINAQVGVVIKHRSSDDGSRIFAEVARTFAAE